MQLSTGPVSTETDMEKTYQVSVPPAPHLTQQPPDARDVGLHRPAAWKARRGALHCLGGQRCIWGTRQLLRFFQGCGRGWVGRKTAWPGKLSLGARPEHQAFSREAAPGCPTSKPGERYNLQRH